MRLIIIVMLFLIMLNLASSARIKVDGKIEGSGLTIESLKNKYCNFVVVAHSDYKADEKIRASSMKKKCEGNVSSNLHFKSKKYCLERMLFGNANDYVKVSSSRFKQKINMNGTLFYEIKTKYAHDFELYAGNFKIAHEVKVR